MPEEFLEDDKTRLAAYKAFQETVEACLDIVAMMVKDSGIVPKDDYSNLENLGEMHEKTKIFLSKPTDFGTIRSKGTTEGTICWPCRA